VLAIGGGDLICDPPCAVKVRHRLFAVERPVHSDGDVQQRAILADRGSELNTERQTGRDRHGNGDGWTSKAVQGEFMLAFPVNGSPNRAGSGGRRAWCHRVVLYILPIRSFLAL